MKEKVYLMHPLQDVASVSKIFTFYYFEYLKDYRSHGESHNFWELNYADKGAFFVKCNDQEYRIDEGSLLIIPPNLHHILYTDNANLPSVFIVSFEAQSPALELLGALVLKATPTIKDLIQSLSREAEQAFRLPLPRVKVVQLTERDDSPLGSQQLVRMRLEELIIHILREVPVQQTGAPQLFTSKARFDDCIAGKILRILERERRRPLELSAITRELGYGKTYLSCVFKKVYGVSIMARHAELRLQDAKRLLREGEMTIAEISDLLGFSSPQYFSRFFTHHENMSPKQYVHSVKAQWGIPMNDKSF